MKPFEKKVSFSKYFFFLFRKSYSLDTIPDFLYDLDFKPLMYLLEIDHYTKQVIINPTKIIKDFFSIDMLTLTCFSEKVMISDTWFHAQLCKQKILNGIWYSGKFTNIIFPSICLAAFEKFWALHLFYFNLLAGASKNKSCTSAEAWWKICVEIGWCGNTVKASRDPNCRCSKTNIEEVSHFQGK